ncbi:olfactory receptor 6C3 [Camelus ferus]|nr:olfactory receptor 6C3 [Camelus ferus]
MSYDRYVAICKPLHYTAIMSRKVCSLLALCAWLGGFLTIFPPVVLLLQLDFCASNVIDHFACDYFPLLQLSCSDTWLLEVMGFYFALVSLLFTLALVILSYMYIIRTVLRIPSASQRKKAFSTCSSHMIVISISYGSCIFMYANPSAKEKASVTKGVAVLNTSVAPMLNPFIYTLRNQQLTQEKRKQMRNYTVIREFILLGLSDDPQLQAVIFIFLLITYMLSITGNLTIITLTLLDSHLQTPMYFFLITLALIFLSYIYIISTIVRIPSTSQRTKAFSTCFSHMIVISISYGSCIFMYIKPSAKDRLSLSKGVAVLNTSVAPMLNPFIYSLRNQQVKRAFMHMARKIVFFSSK